MKLFPSVLLACGGVILFTPPAQAQTFPVNTMPAWKSYMATGNPSDIVSSPAVAAAIGPKVDAINGQSLGQTLRNAVISATEISIPANPSIPTCPVASCPTTEGAGGPVMTAFSSYGSTTLGPQWEYQGYFGLYMNTGRDSATGGIAAPGAKMAAYFGAMQDTQSGPGWGINWNISRNFSPSTGSNTLYGQPGSGTMNAAGGMAANMSTIGAEGDLNNADLDCNGQDGCFIVNEFLNTTSRFTSLAGIFFGASSGQTVASYHDGIFIGGKANGGTADVASDNDIMSEGGGVYGYHSAGSHSVAGIFSESAGQHDVLLTGPSTSSNLNIVSSTSVAKIVINGSSSVGDVIVNTSSPTNVFSVQGTHTGMSAYQDQSTSAAALNASGSYTTAAITTANATNTKIAFTAAPEQEICFASSDKCVEYDGTKLVYSSGNTRLFSIDNSGNMTLSGALTQNGTPCSRRSCHICRRSMRGIWSRSSPS
ncbi:MAG: hypothetical protein ABF932_13520 [Gluconobacter potus]|uniref:Uncharacterized protein n=1 Tax=Gluconobacter potus TaxID=2724927 RepID=A0ABR9YND1_9PROT|nr:MULTISPECIES: hypothetical protein [Gluconobacter]MBF0865140.1 hypothetical protein [Gluconobacter sp. R71656]MBF0883323.1 hypothetical protein [Gluconobacter potus]